MDRQQQQQKQQVMSNILALAMAGYQLRARGTQHSSHSNSKKDIEQQAQHQAHPGNPAAI
jgi:hypothetical protein